MASLINCLEVQSNILDSNGNEPTVWVDGQQFLLSESPTQWNSNNLSSGVYVMLIEPLPGYRIDANMLNIGGILGACTSDGPTKSWFQIISGIIAPDDECGNISAAPNQWPNFPETTLPDEVQGVIAWNAKEPGSCGNYIVAFVLLNYNFEMPGNNKTIAIDWGGTAVECPPEPSIQGYKEITFGLAINAPAWEQVGSDVAQHGNFEIYTARYFSSAEYAQSRYLMSNVFYEQSVNFSGEPSWGRPSYDWLNAYPSGTYPDDSFSSFQPETFERYMLFIEQPEWFDLSNTYANVVTTCGELSMVSNSYSGWDWEDYNISTGGSVPESHPHLGMSNNQAVEWNRSWTYSYNFQSWDSYPNVEDNYYNGINTTVTPLIDPSSSDIIPNTLVWHISVGNNPNYNLVASEETVDVWKIVSYDGQISFSPFETIQATQGCSLSGLSTADNSMNTYFGKSEKNANGQVTTNESDLDLSSVTIEQVDDKTIKLSIPFNSTGNGGGPGGILAQPNGGYDLTSLEPNRYKTKIFINVYPNEI